MTREEYNEFRTIRANIRKWGVPTFGAQYTIRTGASVDFKLRVHRLYSENNLHPASVRVDTRYFDDKERIVYIAGRVWVDDDGKERLWSELYSEDERRRFDAALHA